MPDQHVARTACFRQRYEPGKFRGRHPGNAFQKSGSRYGSTSGFLPHTPVASACGQSFCTSTKRRNHRAIAPPPIAPPLLGTSKITSRDVRGHQYGASVSSVTNGSSTTHMGLPVSRQEATKPCRPLDDGFDFAGLHIAGMVFQRDSTLRSRSARTLRNTLTVFPCALEVVAPVGLRSHETAHTDAPTALQHLPRSDTRPARLLLL